MRVVSQNCNYSVDFDRTVFWTQYNVIYAVIGNDSKVFGQYKTDKRAAEVFEEIHKAYSDMPIIFKNVDISEKALEQLNKLQKNGIVMKLPGESASVEFINDSVYYMPEE